ncbi:LysR substrate-binding domain-containing protein [Paraburkholderia rhizosphaerae]|nr:LysR substrate-binding domain-containing protein [Paraburkholderia rhizosphaerae]
MDLRRIRYFVVLAETLHFGRAALALNIAQPPLSQQIRVLEQELGARLFERSNRRVELTPAGKALLPEARALLAQAERTSTVAARAQRGEIGELRVGLTGSAAFTVVIPRLILSYRQRFPGVRLRIEELTTREQLAALLEQRLDVAIVRSVLAPDLPPTLRATCLLEDSLVVALPAQHRLAGVARPLPISTLAEEPFVMYPRESGTGVYDQIITLCRQAGFAPTVAQEAHAMATILGLVAAGLGVAVVPESLRSVGANGVVYRPIKEKGARSALWLVLWTRQHSAQAAAFAAVAKAS